MQNNDNKIASYQAEFIDFLSAQKYDFQTVKSVDSDLKDYFDWFVKSSCKPKIRLSQSNLLSSYFNFRALQQYLDFSFENSTLTTFKRIVKSIQSFIDFGVLNKWLSDNTKSDFKKLAHEYQQALNDQEQQITLFAQYLQKIEVSKNTLRSYLNDIKEFLVIN